MDDYISKPVERAKLAALLEHWRRQLDGIPLEQVV
jgi:YesN/AraC family two-component response regulator